MMLGLEQRKVKIILMKNYQFYDFIMIVYIRVSSRFFSLYWAHCWSSPLGLWNPRAGPAWPNLNGLVVAHPWMMSAGATLARVSSCCLLCVRGHNTSVFEPPERLMRPGPRPRTSFGACCPSIAISLCVPPWLTRDIRNFHVCLTITHREM